MSSLPVVSSSMSRDMVDFAPAESIFSQVVSGCVYFG
jgi:hypothetical protein